ncbi:Gfo/Idh/MocA family protein [Aquipuribacter sp. SD81]|uniref:Gfo/Idh/MocA family protein n=1 Tax=Aquipuribacter sp. SD81 TaxID=3127703 RepID=UPI003015AFBC
MDLIDAVIAERRASGDPLEVVRTAGYRAAIVGGGFMGEVHARAVRASGGTVVAVAGRDADSGRRAAARLGVGRHHDDIDALVADDDVEVVHVCTPNSSHHAIALAAIEAGKHVVCEKPLATTAADAAELREAAERAGRVGTVPFVYRFHPMVREARERVRAGGLGRLVLVHGSYLQDWLARADDDNWRVDATTGGASRAFADIGSHWCDLMEFVTGQRIESVSAQVCTVTPRRGDRDVLTEDLVTLQLRTDAGVCGATVVSQVSPGRKNRLWLEVSGTDGTLAFDQEDPERLWHGRRGASELLVRDDEVMAPAAARYNRVPAGHPQGYQDCFNAFVEDTAAAVRGETPDGLPTFADGARSAAVVDAVLQAARGSSWVTVPA